MQKKKTRPFVHPPHLSWKAQLMAYIKARFDPKANGRYTADLTKDAFKNNLFLTFRLLWQQGYKVLPRNLREKHVHLVARYWEQQGLSASTIQNRICTLRVFADQCIGKRGMVKRSAHYVRDRASVTRTYIPTEEKSWTRRGINPLTVIEFIAAYDSHVALQLKMMHAFGLRCEEAVSIRPWRADFGDRLYVTEGTKGGRVRDITIRSVYQRQVLDEAKQKVRGVRAFLGDPRYTQRQAIWHFANVLRRFGITRKGLGITSHGLRHGWANDLCESLGWTPPLRQDKDTCPVLLSEDQVRQRLAQELGHNRKNVTSAYVGARIRQPGSRLKTSRGLDK